MIKADDRDQLLQQVAPTPQTPGTQWDVIVIGGGVVGAGIFKFATQLGQKVLLLEQKDFAWGSSSRSSKMVHGGLRYVAEGQYKLTKEAVEEREILIDKAQGLVESKSYVMSHFRWKWPGLRLFTILMWIYSHFAGKKQHRLLSANDYKMLMPGVKSDKLRGGTQYVDALTDDARLVFRLIQEAKSHGGVALNYCKVESLIRDDNEVVTGVMAKAEGLEQPLELTAKMVINATGAWASQLDSQVIIRPLRGSHVLVPSWRLPISNVVTLLHPKDRRPVMIYPWQNTTLIGTTDVDHSESLDNEVRMTATELDYLLVAVNSQFPNAKLQQDDVISTYAGVRPIVLDHPFDPNVPAGHEKRVHSLFSQPGFITVTGGKLTTFRVIANEVLAEAAKTLNLTLPLADFELFSNASSDDASYLAGRYGRFLEQFIAESDDPGLMAPIRYSKILWAELVFAAKYEQVMHLDDLLLRRTRLGNVLPEGAKAELAEIQRLCQPHMSWSDSQWQQEIARYLDIWQQFYSLPTNNSTSQPS
ncbi:MAG: glycerol-3-phosphate dehydrogenase [Phenylobacterium sp.]|jgi:glycerol-3-phosphate dehydrogenase